MNSWLFQDLLKNPIFPQLSGAVKINTPDQTFKTTAGKRLEPPKGPQPFIRHLSYPLTMILIRTPITPNQITTLGMVFGVAAGDICLRGDYLSILILPNLGRNLLGQLQKVGQQLLVV